MPLNQTEFLSAEDIDKVHNTSMAIMAKIGVRFADDETVNTFKHHGFKVEGDLVYIDESQVSAALQTVPGCFTLRARNPERDVIIGDGEPVFAPAYGAPFLVDPDVGKHIPKMDDYHNLARLAQALPNQDVSGHLMVEPNDVAPGSAHLHMLLASILHSDKPFIGSTEGRTGAQDSLEMMRILFGEGLKNPFVIGLINPISPLGFGIEMLEALNVYARAKQPVIIASLVMAGSTGPVTLAGVVAQQNAELLAGIVLTQLINPGTAVIYGSSSTNIEMKSGALAIGSPELSMLVGAHAQLARYYRLPSRAGGALTDSNFPDAQAGFESMFSLLTTVNSGVDFVLHSAGILSSFLTFSFEKFVLDDEICGMIRHYHKGFRVDSDTLAYDVIADVSPGGNFLMEMHTIERCRSEFWQPDLVDRRGLDAWMQDGRPQVVNQASARWKTLLSEHSDPHLDEITKRQLNRYVKERTY